MRWVALFGQPNTGKTSLFNHLTNLNQSVINYPGSTVDISTGQLINHPEIMIIDLPGVHSFIPQSDDERLTLTAITDLKAIIDSAHQSPDLIIMVIDACQPSRHLAMAKRLIDSGYAVIIVLTMIDQLEKDGNYIDHIKLSNELGTSVFKINGRKPLNIDELIDGICLNSVPCGRLIDLKSFHLNDLLDAYNWSESILTKCQIVTQHKQSFDFDKILLHPIFGYFTFFGIMILFFSLIFYVSAPFMDGIEYVFNWTDECIQSLNIGLFGKFLSNGLISGIAGVVIFIPQIALLFFGMGIMESTGYLARSAALIDRPLSKLGLNGRSFVPLLSGCACAIPAILATRTIPNKRVRLLTIFIIPLMQCSARLPVYGLLLGLLFQSSLHSALALTGIYIGSIVVSSVLLKIAGLLVPIDHSQPNYFVIELPKWQLPIWADLIRQLTKKVTGFISEAGPIIIIITIVLWILSSFPSEDHSFLIGFSQYIEPIFSPMGVDWRVGVAIILSFAAREVFVSSLAVIMNISDPGITNLSNIATITFQESNEPIFTTGSIIGLIIFFMIAMQCGATLAVVKKETQSVLLATTQLFLFIILAYALAILSNIIF